jgi:hypothetical protein
VEIAFGLSKELLEPLFRDLMIWNKRASSRGAIASVFVWNRPILSAGINRFHSYPFFYLLFNDRPFRSAEYDESEQTCRMSREDRRTQPLAFRRDAGSWDYLENQCVKSELNNALTII